MTTQHAHLSHPKYRPDIDGLRAIAVLAVVAFHAFPSSMKGGFIGVDVFFVISGFLISTIIFENLDKGTFSFAEFYSRRIKRIFPALLLVLSFSYVAGWVALFSDEYKQLGQHIASGSVFSSNFMLWSEAGYFDNSAETKPLLHLWSLGIEEQFYIIWPLVLWVAWKKKFNLLTLSIIAAAISFHLNLKGIKRDAIATFYSPQTRFWELLCGCILAYFCLYKQEAQQRFGSKVDAWLNKALYREARQADGQTLSNVLSAVGLLLLIHGFSRINHSMEFPGKWAMLPVAGAVCLILAGPNAWVNRRILANKVAVWFGLISFPLYLWHWPLLSYARIVEGEAPQLAIRIAAVVVSIALAWLTYRFVEGRMRHGGNNKAKVSALVSAMVVMGTVGYLTSVQGGIPSRAAAKFGDAQAADLTFVTERMDGWLCDTLTYRGENCHYTSTNPSVVVIGDSHAPRIYSGLRELYTANGKGIALFGGGSGCPPLLDVISKDDGGNDERDCLVKMTGSLNKIMSEPGIKEVILAARGPLYTTGYGFEGDFEGDRSRPGGWVLHRPNEPQRMRSNAEVYYSALAETLDALLAAGKSVTFLYDVPELGFDIKRCLASRPARLTKKTDTLCAIPRQKFEDRNKDFRLQTGKILREHPAVKVIDLAEAMCDDQYCYGGKDGALYYTDDDHLSRRGSELVVHRLWDKFNAPYAKHGVQPRD